MRQDIFKKFSSAISDISNSRDLRDNFNEFLDFQLFFFCSNPTEGQIEKFNLAVKEKGVLYKNAMLLLGEGSEDFSDVLGEFFMQNVSMGRNGQFFTPEVVCRFMSQITEDETAENKTVNDPCCGSGRMLLASARNSKFPHSKKYYANDIDSTCAKMCLLNMLLNSLSGVVTCGDGLAPMWMQGRETYIVSGKKICLGEKFLFYPQYKYYSSEESQRLYLESIPKEEQKEIPTVEQLEFTKEVQPIGNGDQLSLF